MSALLEPALFWLTVIGLALFVGTVDDRQAKRIERRHRRDMDRWADEVERHRTRRTIP